MSRLPIIFSICFSMLLFSPTSLVADDPASDGAFRVATTSRGVRLELRVDHAVAGKTPGRFHENDHVAISLKITDVANQAPMKSLYPAAWMDPIKDNAPTTTCAQKVKTFLSGSVFTRAEIDLNVFLVVTMTADGFITVVDPLFSFGGSKLLGMVQLESPGADWALSRDKRRLYVTLPEAGKLVEIDTSSWTIHRSIPMPNQPRALLVQPDQHYLWVACGQGEKEGSGVVAVVRDSMTIAKRIPTGAGFHDLVLDREAENLFVSNSEAGHVSVIDVRKLVKIKDIPTGKRPVAMAYSQTAQLVLLADHAEGRITAINASSHEVLARMKADKGLRQIEFAPDGRLAMAISPDTKGLFIVDAARNRIIQDSRLKGTPSHLSFSDTLGYIMFEDTDQVLMAPLGEIGKEGEPIPLGDFPGGFYKVPALDEPLLRAVAKAPAENGVMLADTKAETINYYMEGMAAPMGSFSNYHHPPKGILVIDRSLQEQNEPGLYQTVTKLGKAGTYSVAVFLDSPRLVHCFNLPVLPEPQKADRIKAALKHLTQKREVIVGEPQTIAIKLVDAKGKGIPDLTDVVMILHMAGGRWFERLRALHRGDGVYSVDVRFPMPGNIQTYVQCKSAGLTFADGPMMPLRAIRQTKAELSSPPGDLQK